MAIKKSYNCQKTQGDSRRLWYFLGKTKENQRESRTEKKRRRFEEIRGGVGTLVILELRRRDTFTLYASSLNWDKASQIEIFTK